MSRHRAEYDNQTRDNDVIAGIREDFWFRDRNGKHRAVETPNPFSIKDEQEQAA